MADFPPFAVPGEKIRKACIDAIVRISAEHGPDERGSKALTALKDSLAKDDLAKMLQALAYADGQ